MKKEETNKPEVTYQDILKDLRQWMEDVNNILNSVTNLKGDNEYETKTK